MKKCLLFIIVCFFLIFDAQTQEEGLISYYPFNSNANDESSNGNDGIVHGATLTSDRFGNPNAAYSFDGVNDYIEVPHDNTLNPGTQISIGAWVYLYDGTNNYILQKFDIPNGYQLRILGDSVSASVGSGYQFYSHSLLEYDQWNHIVVTYDGSNYKVYINNVLDASGSISSSMNSESSLVIGKHQSDVNYFNGKIDDICIYNDALSEYEIDSIYHVNSWGNSFNNIVAYYPFNSNANDESGNGNDGIVHGATLTSDRFGNPNAAYSFDGVNDYIEVPHDNTLNPGTQISIGAWVYLYDGTNNYILQKFDIPNGYQLRILGDSVSASVGSGYQFYSHSLLEYDQWNHIVVTYDGSNYKVYINNVLDASGSISSSMNSESSLVIGKHQSDVNYFNGKIDDICIYNDALSEYEIDSIYHTYGWTNIIKQKRNINYNYSLFPNPNNGYFSANFNNDKTKELKIFSLEGKVIYKSTLIDNNCDFNLSGIKSGIYLFRVKYDQYTITKKLFIK